MKHVFFVHSNITYLASLGVICQDNLSLEDIIIFSDSFFVDSPIKIIALETPTFKDALFRFRWLSWLNIPKYIDKQILKYTQGDIFTAYVPEVHRVVGITITHEKCVQVNFIEEGSLAYVKINDIKTVFRMRLPNSSWRPNLKKRIKDAVNTFREGGYDIVKLPYYYFQYPFPLAIRFYGFFDTTFTVVSIERKIKLSFRDIVQRFYIDENWDLNITEGDTILLGSAFLSDFQMTRYFNALEKIATDVSLMNQSIFLKFHHSETDESKKEIIRRLKSKGINITIISKEVMLEVIFIKTPNLVVYGLGSSLNIYAELLGHRSIDYTNMIEI